MIRVLLIFALVYFILRMLFRYILPIVFTNYFGKKMEDMMGKNASNFQNQQKHKKEGEVTIDFGNTSKKHVSKDSGDYVDFEEIK